VASVIALEASDGDFITGNEIPADGGANA